MHYLDRFHLLLAEAKNDPTPLPKPFRAVRALSSPLCRLLLSASAETLPSKAFIIVADPVEKADDTACLAGAN
jgi:hypothetical protein